MILLSRLGPNKFLEKVTRFILKHWMKVLPNFGPQYEVTNALLKLDPQVPSQVQLLGVASDGFTIGWCDPINEPQCAKYWDMETKELPGEIGTLMMLYNSYCD